MFKEGIGHESSKLNSNAFGRRSGDKALRMSPSQKEGRSPFRGIEKNLGRNLEGLTGCLFFLSEILDDPKNHFQPKEA